MQHTPPSADHRFFVGQVVKGKLWWCGLRCAAQFVCHFQTNRNWKWKWIWNRGSKTAVITRPSRCFELAAFLVCKEAFTRHRVGPINIEGNKQDIYPTQNSVISCFA